MFIREMTEEECIAVVKSGRLARLACSKEDRPYVVPIHYAYADVASTASRCRAGRSSGCEPIRMSACRLTSFQARISGRACSYSGSIRSFRRRRNGMPSACTPGLFSRNISLVGAWGIEAGARQTLGASPHLFYCISVDEMTGRAAVEEDRALNHRASIETRPYGTSTAAPIKRPARRSSRAAFALSSG